MVVPVRKLFEDIMSDSTSHSLVVITVYFYFHRSRHYIGGWEDYCKQTGVPLKKTQDDGFGVCGNYYNRFDQYFL